MITDVINKWHYLAVTKLSAFLKGVTSKYNINFFFQLHSFGTKTKRDSHEKFCKNLDFCEVVMPDEKTIILEYSYGSKSIKHRFVIYADFETLLEKTDCCEYNIS